MVSYRIPEIVSFAFVTEQDVKQNFLRIQDEIDSLFYRPAVS